MYRPAPGGPRGQAGRGCGIREAFSPAKAAQLAGKAGAALRFRLEQIDRIPFKALRACSAAPGPADGSYFPGAPAAAEESVRAIGFEP